MNWPLFDVSVDALLGRKGASSDAAYAITALSDESQRLLPEVVEIRARLQRAYRELEAEFDFTKLAAKAGSGAQWNPKNLAPEERRAYLLWALSALAVIDASVLIEHLVSITAVPQMATRDLNRELEPRSREFAAKKARSPRATEYLAGGDDGTAT